MDPILDFLAAEDADVVFLQEVYNGDIATMERRFRSIEVLQERLHYDSVEFAPLVIDKFHEGDVMAGNAVLAKFPTTAGETIFFNSQLVERDPYKPETVEGIVTLPRILQHVILDTSAGDVHAFNIHGAWDLDGDNFGEDRRRMRDAILAAIDGKPNVILAGDTNAQPTNQAMRDVEQHLHSVFGTELTSTFNMKHKKNPGYATARVDMIFVSPNIKVLERHSPKVDVSDHLPLIARLEIT